MITKLDAVNEMLDAIGESSVASLESSLSQAEDAERILDRHTLKVLAKGWNCNMDRNFELPVDANSEIPLPYDVLRIVPVGRSQHLDVAQRYRDGTRLLYDVRNQTFQFKGPVSVNVTWRLPFETITPELQGYIVAKAQQDFQIAELGSASLDGFIARDIVEEYAGAMDAESEQGESNILTDNRHAAYIMRRSGSLWRH